MTAESYVSHTTRLAREELGACALIEDLLPLYIEGEVSPGSRDLITEHLARCERCAGFMAGAQSVRAQLRREQSQRAGVITNKLPEQRAVAKGQWIVVLMAVLACCAIGTVGSMLGWHGLSDGEVVAVLVGGGAVTTAFGLLLVLAGVRAPLTFWRVALLTISSGLGSLAAMAWILGGDDPGVFFVGLLFACLGLAGVWTAVWGRKK
jgi:hypothetical protein